MATRPGLFCSHHVLDNCVPKRRAQVPAWNSQLSVGLSKVDRKYSVRLLHTSSLRCTPVYSEQKRNVKRYSTDAQGQAQVQNYEGNTTSRHAPWSQDGAQNIANTKDQKVEARNIFRKYMQKAVHPVAIVTSTDTSIDPRGEPESWRGATVSSFNSVTLDPEPYISFNIKRISSTYDAIRHSGLLTVHLMSHTPQAVTIATQFSKGNNARPFFKQSSNPSTGSTRQLQPFMLDRAIWHSKINTDFGESLPPLLQWRQRGLPRAVLFHVLCKYQVEKSVDVGDHVVVIGKVLSVMGNLDDKIEREHYGALVPDHCLSYMNGHYSNPHAGDRTRLEPAKDELSPTLPEVV